MSGFNFVSGWTPQFGINSRAPTPANPGMMQQFEPYGQKAGDDFSHQLPGTVNLQQLLLTPSGQNENQRRGLQHAARVHPPPFPPSPTSFRPVATPHNGQQRTHGVHDLTDSGPKQSRKPAPAAPPPTVDDVRASFPRYDPNVLLGGAKAAINGGPVSNGAPPNDINQSTTAEPGTGEALGFSHFMSNLHPTVNRDSVPQRKRKAETNDDDDTPAKQKSTFTGISKGGIISEHLRAEREKAAAEAGPSNIAIDLTADDDDGKGKDDDLMFMGEKQKKSVSEENKEVCLGGLQGKANISRIPMYSDRALAGLGKDTWPRLKLDHRRSENGQNNLKIELLDRAQRVVGLIEFRVAAALVPLLNGNNTNRLRMVVWLAQWPRAKNDRPGQHVSKHLDIQIILYAPRKHTAMIGKYLSQKQLFLTSLAGVYIGKELENPHVPANFGGRGERKPQMSQPVHQVVRDPNELRREAQGMFDKMIRHEDLAEMEAEPSIIKTPLLAHQKQALQFMTDHEHNAPPKAGEAPAFSLWKPERSRHGHDVWVHVITGQEEANEPKPVYGGILADMMGLGKTLSILSLIAHTKKEAEAFGQKELPRSSEYLERNAKTTVIICPKSVMSNWQEQIKIHVKSNKLSYYNYHGSNRHQDLDELAKYDIILTTYGTAAEDLKAKGKALFQVNWFRIVLDEAHGIRNQNTGVSKACIALTAERRWAVTGTPVQNGLNDMGALVKFLRIYPFDHSHTWNTHIIIPLKSGNTDVIAHLRLLVDSITLRRLKDKIGLKDRKEVENHLEFSEADRKVYERIANQSSRDMMLMTGGKTAMKGKAYAHMLRLIDRMRRYCAHGLDMFNEEDRKQIAEGMNPDNAIAVDLGDEPDYEPYEFIGKQQAYETLHLINESDTDRCEKCGNKLSDKPLDAEGNADASGDEEDETSSDSESDDSGTTNTKADDVLSYLTPCFHVLCPGCKDTYIEQANESMTVDQRHECPSCNTFIRFGLFEFHRSGLQEYLDEKNAKTKKRNGRRIWDETNYNGPSAKVLALIHDLQLAAAESADLEALGEPPIRSVVFSQWTSYLDLIEVALEEHEIGFTRLDGTMSIGQRTRVMELFKTDPRVTVILVSIKAGGQGLNFTAASRVFMMEPQYNPGVEQQAIDRVHRLGQRRDVLITHYFITNTIEQKIQQLQRRKEDLARFTLERKLSKVEEAKKRIEGLRDLFR